MMPHSDTIVIRAQLAAGASTFRAKSMELLRAIVERARALVKMTQFARIEMKRITRKLHAQKHVFVTEIFVNKRALLMSFLL
jgi:hypothetical protein